MTQQNDNMPVFVSKALHVHNLMAAENQFVPICRLQFTAYQGVVPREVCTVPSITSVRAFGQLRAARAREKGEVRQDMDHCLIVRSKASCAFTTRHLTRALPKHRDDLLLRITSIGLCTHRGTRCTGPRGQGPIRVTLVLTGSRCRSIPVAPDHTGR